MTTFLLIRHATNDYVDKALAGWLPGIHLNKEGKMQAESLASRLEHLPIQAIYSSPLERATETALPLAKRHRLEILTDASLGEVHFGDWTGLSLDQLARDPLWQQFKRQPSGTRPPQGELIVETQNRMATTLERLLEEHPGQTVALVTHADPIRAALAYYAGIPLDLIPRVEIGPASLSVVILGGSNPIIQSINTY
jgi:probable phosphomutase (TIGR03848 family)